MRAISFLIVCALLMGQSPANAAARTISIDDSKSKKKSLTCDGISIPITYDLLKPLASGDTLKVNIFHKGVFEQAIKLAGVDNGSIKNMSWGGRDWFGTSAGNPTSTEWYILPISKDPTEACAQFKSDISFAKKKFMAYKSLVAVFILKP